MAETCPALLEEELEKSDKEGKSWRKRWFVATDTLIYYYENKTQTEAKGTILFSKITSVTADTKQRKSRANCFVITFKVDDVTQETRVINCETPESKVKWMEGIRDLAHIYNHRDDYKDAHGAVGQFFQRLVEKVRKSLDHSCKLIGVGKALVGSRAKKEMDEKEREKLFKDLTLVGATAIRTVKQVLKSISDPFSEENQKLLLITMNEWVLSSQRIQNYCSATSNKGAADYNFKQIYSMLEDFKKEEPLTYSIEVASNFEEIFNVWDVILGQISSDTATKLETFSKLGRQFLISAKLIKRSIPKEEHNSLGERCISIGKLVDALIQEAKKFHTNSSDSELKMSVTRRQQELQAHLQALVNHYENIYKISIRKPITVNFLGPSNQTDRSIEGFGGLSTFAIIAQNVAPGANLAGLTATGYRPSSGNYNPSNAATGPAQNNSSLDTSLNNSSGTASSGTSSGGPPSTILPSSHRVSSASQSGVQSADQNLSNDLSAQSQQ